MSLGIYLLNYALTSFVFTGFVWLLFLGAILNSCLLTLLRGFLLGVIFVP